MMRLITYTTILVRFRWIGFSKNCRSSSECAVGSSVMEQLSFEMRREKTDFLQISFAVTVKLISAFVFTTRILLKYKISSL